MPAAVTFDLWYTLLALSPHDGARYLKEQEDRAVDLLDSWPDDPSPRTAVPLVSPRMAFRVEFETASISSRLGLSIPTATQIQIAAQRCGKAAAPAEYLASVTELVEGMEFRVSDGAPEALAELRENGYRIGVVSNTVGEPGAALEQVCRNFGLDRWIEEWAWSDQHPWAKPAPELFHWCLERLGVPASSAVHVGDGASDIEGGQRAGYRGTVHYTGASTYSAEYRKRFAPPIDPSADPPTATLQDLRDLQATVRRVLPIGPDSGGRTRPPAGRRRG
jgi:HAD superfamily hydrolase (TIGR01549 family)